MEEIGEQPVVLLRSKEELTRNEKKTEPGPPKSSSIFSMSTGSSKVVYFIVGSMLCEHLCESGLRSIMALYFKKMLDLEGYQITIALHFFNFLKYFAVLVGSIMADSFFGKSKTILFSQLVYSTGTVLLTLSSIIKRSFPNRMILLLALLTKIIGLGGILPCLIPLAADQISETETQNKVKNLFVVYFVAVQICDIVSVLFVPMMKEVPCLGLETCYPLAFGAPALFSVLSFGLFASVYKHCYSIKPRQPIVFQGVQCCFHAIRVKISKRKELPHKKHWLDYADDKFDLNFIESVKCTMNVLAIPIPLYWSLYEQQSTTWTIQASNMDNEIGPIRVLPDQVQALCPMLLVVLIPLFNYFLYDLLGPLKILKTFLRRMISGGFLIIVAFLIAFAVELKIEDSHRYGHENKGGLRIYNGLNNSINMTISSEHMLIKPFSYYPVTFDLHTEKEKVKYCFNYENKLMKDVVEIQHTKAMSIIILNSPPIEMVKIQEKSISEETNNLVNVRLICTHKTLCKNLTVSLDPDEWFLQKERNCTITDVKTPAWFDNIPPGIYRATILYKTDSDILSKVIQHYIRLKTGGEYSLMVYFIDEVPDCSLFAITPPNSVSVLWIIPQYFFLAISGALFTISAYSFIYTETPDMFKSFSWSACFMTLSIGNIITVIVGGTPLEPAYNFLLFAGMMVLGMLVFIYAAHKYKYRSHTLLQSKIRIFSSQ